MERVELCEVFDPMGSVILYWRVKDRLHDVLIEFVLGSGVLAPRKLRHMLPHEVHRDAMWGPQLLDAAARIRPARDGIYLQRGRRLRPRHLPRYLGLIPAVLDDAPGEVCAELERADRVEAEHQVILTTLVCASASKISDQKTLHLSTIPTKRKLCPSMFPAKSHVTVRGSLSRPTPCSAKATGRSDLACALLHISCTLCCM
ncbi:hypothetical protein BV25DRAFT_1254776 [Artomyces pyxidatus]|uniref:Uncharacterized protein n=1 Tax=Artomyces pyxidatus TaxID=48021 RepID=A0ACB8TEJ6_9AGAM|nr:hypothetical protein BV25DRAFT_1254776 [Artomyces pyxidatus]